MSRRGTSLKVNPLPRKLSEDIWDLANCLASGKHVKYTMYKGGKRDREYLSKMWKDKGVSGELVSDEYVDYSSVTSQPLSPHEVHPSSI